MKVTILGDGGWGTALAKVLAENGAHATLWGAFPDNLKAIAKERENKKFLPNVRLPEALDCVAELPAAAAGADFILLATPVQFLRGVLETLAPVFRPEKQRVVSVVKGLEEHTCLRVSQMAEEVLGKHRCTVLSGPSHAEEVGRNIPTAVVAASRMATEADEVRKLFMNDNFRVYTSGDVTGVELGGAIKNVIALAAGMLDGLELGDNPKAALLTRGIAEMSRVGRALGGEALTFAGLSGIGDLIVTCSSRHSRNRRVGEELGRGKSLAEITAAMNMQVAEGVRTAPGAAALARRAGVETPIIDSVCDVLQNRVSPLDAARRLMTRAPKAELD